MGIMYFPDEVPNGNKKKKKKKKSWFMAAYDWCFNGSLVRLGAIVFIFMLLNFILCFFIGAFFS